MSEDVPLTDEEIEKIVRQEVKQEESRASSETKKPVIEEDIEVPEYIQALADVASKKKGIPKESIIRAFRDLMKEEDVELRKLVRLNEITDILSKLRRAGELTSQIADLGMAKLAHRVVDSLSLDKGEDDDMRWLEKMIKQMYRLKVVTEMMKVVFGEASEGRKGSDGSGNDVQVIMQTVANAFQGAIDSLREELNELKKELKATKAEKSISEIIEESVRKYITSIDDKLSRSMSSVEERLKKLEEERRRKEYEEIINALSSKFDSLKEEIERLKKERHLLAALSSGGKEVDIDDLISKYRSAIESVNRLYKELEELQKEVSGRGRKEVPEKLLSELRRLRAEVNELREKADLAKALGSVLENPEKIMKYVDMVTEIASRVKKLRDMFSETVQPAEGGEEEIEEPEIIEKILSESGSEGRESGEEVSAGGEVSEGGGSS